MKKEMSVLLLCISLFMNYLCAQTWSAVGIGLVGPVYTLGVYNNSLYAGGTIVSAGGSAASNIAKWDGGTWTSPDSGVGGNITSMTTYNGELIVAGTFNASSGVTTYNIARWNDTSWGALGNGMAQDLEAVAVYNGELYAAGTWILQGSFQLAHIGHWNGSGNFLLMPDIDSLFSQFRALATYNNELYVAGVFNNIGGITAYGIARWNGSNWSPCGTSAFFGGIFSLCVFNGDLYVGGEFDSIGGIAANSIAKWNGSNWSAVGDGVTGTSGLQGMGDVLAIAEYNGELYAAGYFDTAGTIAANNIARWDGTNWSALGSGIIGNVNSLAEYNGDLYAGGTFHEAGGSAISYLARWNSPVSVPSFEVNKPSLFPVPCAQKLFVESAYKKGMYELKDVTGNLLQKNMIYSAKFEIDMDEYKAGIYFLFLHAEGKQIHSIILKE